MTEKLTSKKCIPCEGGVNPLVDWEITELLAQVPGWEVKLIESDGKQVKSLQQTLKFENFRKAMAFLRKVEEIAESEGHHPDFCVHYSKVDFTIWTHSISGLHENDFILASKIQETFEKQ